MRIKLLLLSKAAERMENGQAKEEWRLGHSQLPGVNSQLHLTERTQYYVGFLNQIGGVHQVLRK